MSLKNKALYTLRKDASSTRAGLHRGQVVSIDDPDRLGRVKVRVFAIHRDKFHVPDSSLPWADIAELGGGGYDYGSFDPPPVGSTVWVGFEAADEDFPVVLGTFRGVPKRDDENPQIMLTADGDPVSEKPWTPPDDETETPKDVFGGVHTGEPHPTRRVWRKSYKGHTILVEDGDGKEFIKIIDRAGQIIVMDCAVQRSISEGNAAQRGTRDSMRGDQLPHSAMVNNRASIRIKDLSGQEIVLNAKSSDESLLIKSKSRDSGLTNEIRLRSGRGRERIEILDSGGDSIVLDPNSAESIALQDTSGNRISFRKDEGIISFQSANGIREDAQQKSTQISGKSEKTVAGDDVSTIQGNLKTNVINDASVGVLGNTLASLGGALKLVVTNTAPSGPETNAIDVNVVSGDISVINTLGKIVVEAIAGDAELKTKLGDILVETLSGDATLATLLGDAVVSGGPDTKLGSATASEPVVCGNLWSSLMDTLITAFLLHTHTSAAPGSPTTPPVLGSPEWIAIKTILAAGPSNPSNPLSINVTTIKEKII